MEAEGFQFELWSDAARTLALTYGAASDAEQARAARVTVVLDAEGKLALTYPSVGPVAHPQDVLEDCEVLFGR